MYNLKGAAHYALGNLDLAIDLYNKAISLNPKYAISYNNIGMIYQDQGNYEKALEYYSKCLAIDEEIGNKKRMGNSYNKIGNILRKDQ